MKEIQSLSVVAPGFFGLNTQDSGVTLSSNYALVADNCVIDRLGRVGARKGAKPLTVNGVAALNGESVKFMMEHVNALNTTTLISGGNNKLFTGDITLVDVTPTGYVVANDYWAGATLLDHAMIVQKGQEPLIYNEASTPVLQTMSAFTGNAQAYGTSYPRDVIAAYGRFWAHDGETIYWSTDIADSVFPSFFEGSSGTLNVSAVLPNNVDKIVALGSHNGFLIIFCANNILLYSGASEPLNEFKFHDVIAGVGCIARNSVQATGNDLIFLSETGIRSLGRVIQEKSLPMRDLTKNVRDDIALLLQIGRASDIDLRQVKSVYSERNAFYLISFPVSNIVYCLDMRQALEDGSSRITRWVDYKVASFLRTRSREVYLGQVNGISTYAGYLDNTLPYSMRFLSPFLDMQDSTQVKILKKITATVIGGNNQAFIMKAGFDYVEDYDSYAFVIETQNASEYNNAEYGIGEYTKGSLIAKVDSSVGGSGNVIQIGFETEIDNAAFSVQKLDIFMKIGRKI